MEFDCYGDGTQCIYRDQTCDGIPHCRDSQDEDPELCKSKHCMRFKRTNVFIIYVLKKL